jgi:hypothetical protein
VCAAPLLKIPGFAHPVRELHLEDLVELTGYIIDESSEYAMRYRTAKSKKGRGGGGSSAHKRDRKALMAEAMEVFCCCR